MFEWIAGEGDGRAIAHPTHVREQSRVMEQRTKIERRRYALRKNREKKEKGKAKEPRGG